ncbi:MAG: hypothetical protein AB7D57_10495 [Desulfovibrionaceae bacterium]
MGKTASAGGMASFCIGLAMIAVWGWIGTVEHIRPAAQMTVFTGLAFAVNGIGAFLGVFSALRSESMRTVGLIGASLNAAQPIFILLYSAAFRTSIPSGG